MTGIITVSIKSNCYVSVKVVDVEALLRSIIPYLLRVFTFPTTAEIDCRSVAICAAFMLNSTTPSAASFPLGVFQGVISARSFVVPWSAPQDASSGILHTIILSSSP